MNPNQQDQDNFFTGDQNPSYVGEELNSYNPNTHQVPQHIEWQASEYIQHDKGTAWVIIAGSVALALAIGAAIIGAWTFAALIVVMGVAFIVYGMRQPKIMTYSLDPTSLTINGKTYDYSNFRAFGVVPDGGLYSIMLIPTKRFMPELNLYFDEKDGEQIVDLLGSHLPMEELKLNYVDQLMRKLHF